jgi:hypothetical protein
VPPCEKCGSQRKRVGFVPHRDNAAWRLDLYRCEQCGDRTRATVKLGSRRGTSDPILFTAAIALGIILPLGIALAVLIG